MVVYVDIHIFFLYFHAVRDLAMATTSQRRKYNNNPDIFRYICGIFTLQGQRRNINNLSGRYFKVPLGDQDRKLGSSQSVQSCVETL